MSLEMTRSYSVSEWGNLLCEIRIAKQIKIMSPVDLRGRPEVSRVVSLKLTIWWGFGLGLVVGEPGVWARGNTRPLCGPGVAPDWCADPRPGAPGPTRPLTPSAAWAFPAWPHATPARACPCCGAAASASRPAAVLRLRGPFPSRQARLALGAPACSPLMALARPGSPEGSLTSPAAPPESSSLFRNLHKSCSTGPGRGLGGKNVRTENSRR